MTLGLHSGSVQLAAPDPAWAAEFIAARARLLAAAGALPLAVEHVGSTAIPGIPAKPILDLLGGRPPGSDVAPYVSAFEAVGYRYRGENGGTLWCAHLAFRDFLRGHPEHAAEYAALKQSLVAQGE